MTTASITDLQHEVHTATQLIAALESAPAAILDGIVESVSDKIRVLKRRRDWLQGEIQRIQDGVPF